MSIHCDLKIYLLRFIVVRLKQKMAEEQNHREKTEFKLIQKLYVYVIGYLYDVNKITHKFHELLRT